MPPRDGIEETEAIFFVDPVPFNQEGTSQNGIKFFVQPGPPIMRVIEWGPNGKALKEEKVADGYYLDYPPNDTHPQYWLTGSKIWTAEELNKAGAIPHMEPTKRKRRRKVNDDYNFTTTTALEETVT